MKTRAELSKEITVDKIEQLVKITDRNKTYTADDMDEAYQSGIEDGRVGIIDARPLTDETLEELGFEMVGMIGMKYWEYKYSDEFYLVAKRNPDYAVPYICGIEWCDKPICKTVGSVKLLIEALKGDE